MRLLISGYGPGPTLGVWEDGRPLWVSHEESCSWLCRGGGYLFGVTEAEPTSAVHLYQAEGDGGHLYQAEGDGGHLYQAEGDGFRRLDSRAVEGGALCHLAWLERPGLLVGACYGSGDLVVFAPKGERLGSSRVYHQGGRVHCAAPSADGARLYTVNIARDRLPVYTVGPGGLREETEIILPRGVGPRHLLPRGRSLWVVTEYSNELLRVEGDRLTERFSLLPPGFSGEAYGSGLCINGRFLYAGVRGADLIAVFRLEGDSARPAGWFSCGGRWPRALESAGEGRLVCANQHSGEVVVWRLHPETGLACGEEARVPFAGASFAERLD